MSSLNQKLNHLYNRAAFGYSVQGDSKEKKHSVSSVVRNMFQRSSPEPLYHVKEDPVAKYAAMARNRQDIQQMRSKLREEIEKSQQKIRELNLLWMERMNEPDQAALEKLTLFWHDHFGVRERNAFKAQEHNNTLRKYALGPYRDLLVAVAQDPAMLQFLNNQQNSRVKPNENFARELLELFTIGRGNYSEEDVKNAARAFTGWSFNRRTNKYQFRPRQHDYDQKHFFGQSGNFNGEDIIDIVLKDKRTARYLAAKFFHYYVSEKPDEEIIEVMADYYFKSNYHTGELLNFMFRSDWFYENRFINTKIKSPIELINGFRKHLGLEFSVKVGWLFLQRSFAQVLFNPPSVNGWPLGREWIDSSSLVSRMKLPAVFAGVQTFDKEETEGADANDPFNFRGDRLMRSARLDLSGYERMFTSLPDAKKLDLAAAHLINRQVDPEKKSAMLQQLSKLEEIEKTEWIVLTIASLPEYQLN